MKNQDHNLRNNIIKGAAGVALTAGMVAAGVALMNQSNRKKVGRGLKKGVEGFRGVIDENMPKIQSYAHRVMPSEKNTKTVVRKRKISRSRK